MFETLLFDAERNNSYERIFIFVFTATLIIAFVNYFIGGNFMFLVALVSLAFAYPIVNYLREEDKFELERRLNSKSLVSRHAKELGVFLMIFIAIVFAFFISVEIGFVTDFTFQEKILDKISGKLTDTSVSFYSILLNNLEVALFTFVISIVIFSGILLVLSWNASILVYYVWSVKNVSNVIFILPHALLEVGGYIMAGICGSIIAYRFDRKNKFGHKFNSEFFKDLIILALLSLGLILVGAIIEVL